MSSHCLIAVIFLTSLTTSLVLDTSPFLTQGAKNISSSTASLNIVKPLTNIQSTDTLSPSFESFNTTAPNPFPVTCDADLGQHMTFEPCKDAWDYTSPDRTVKTFGNRASGPWGLDLPFRYIGSDGTCIIDVEFTNRDSDETDRASYLDIRRAAFNVIGICVTHHGYGGKSVGVGIAGRLTVTVQTFIPRVTCVDAPIKPPDKSVCPFVIDQMPSDKVVKGFGRRGTLGVDVPLPWAMADPDLQCVVKVGVTVGAPVSSSWFDMWGYAVALGGMCVRHGRAGRAVTEDGRLAVTVRNERPFAANAEA